MNEVPARCAPFEEDLSALLDEQLDPRRASEVRAHLASCADCTRRQDALRGVDLALQRIAAAPVGAGQRVRMRPVLAPAQPAHRAPPRRRRWIAPAALVATAAAAATLMLLVRPPPPALPGPAAKIDRSAVATTPPPAAAARAESVAESAGGIASPDLLDDASDEDLALATALHEFPVLDSPRDLELVEQLDLLETLGALDHDGAGRG